jgi:hypothetical protein
VDRAARDALAKELRLLATGKLTNFEYERRLPPEVWNSRDPGVTELRWCAWGFYCDFREHRLRGADAPPSKRPLARMLVFLGSDLPYGYPVEPFWLTLLLMPIRLLTLGGVNLLLKRRLAPAGDLDSWPFLNRHDAERAARDWPAKA